MKAVILALAIAGVAATGSVEAQVIGARLPTPSSPSTTRGTVVNGSWQVVGQDRYGTIYERRTYDANGNILVQRARRDANGNFSIIDSRTERRTNNDCQYASTTTVGGVILGRPGTNGTATDCRNDRRRSVDGVWRQVGQGRNNNSVYERRTYDGYGNIVVQKARRNPNGTFTILSTRTIRNNQNVRDRHGDDDDYRGYNGRHDDDDKGHGKSERHGNGRGKGHNGRD
ncbi:MAG TPA: hypothetical protein VJ825_14490 [Gemmatimonadaceae bacterium]|nr:hypothetical protein [Gemmatimonadaceae bacterium]